MFQIENDEIREIEKQNALRAIISLMKTYAITLHEVREQCEIPQECLSEQLHISLAD